MAAAMGLADGGVPADAGGQARTGSARLPAMLRARPRGVMPVLVAACLALACGAAARADATGDLVPFRITTDPHFVHPRQSLTRLAEINHSYGVNKFCVVGWRAQHPGPYQMREPWAWIYWPRQNELVMWEFYDGWDQLDAPAHVLDLSHDVIDSEAERHGAMYKVTRTWVNDMLATCRKYGQDFTIDVPPPGKHVQPGGAVRGERP